MNFSYYIGDARDPRIEQLTLSTLPLGPELPDGLGVFWDICNRPDLEQFDIWTYLLRLSREDLERLLTNVYGEGWGLPQPEPPDGPAWRATLAEARRFLQSMPPGSLMALVAIDISS